MTDIPSPSHNPPAADSAGTIPPIPPLEESAPSMAPLAAPLPSPRLATVNGVNWSNVFDFINVFRGFRLAINPAKLGLALLAIFLIYSAGRLFDAAWGPQAYADEISDYAARTSDEFAAERSQKNELRSDFLELHLASDSSLSTDQASAMKNHPREAYRALRTAYEKKFHDAVTDAAKDRQETEKLQAANASDHVSTDSPTPEQQEQLARQSAANDLAKSMHSLHDITGHGIFDTFLDYETTQFDRLIGNTLSLIRIAPAPAPADITAAQEQALSGTLFTRNPANWYRSDTVAGCLANMTITAPSWLFSSTGPMQWKPEKTGAAGWIEKIGYRGLYLASLLLFAIFSLILIAFTGASITRLSALEIAGIERAPLKDVFVYAFRRLGSFLKTPLMPFAILLCLGLILTFVGIAGAIPWIGPIIIGAVFFFFLAVAFVLMLIVLGILGGFHLLYPAVAIEGADAFDAMSRAFAYVYSRPWRLLWYSLMALIYGAITLLFVSFAVYIILMFTHTFAGWGVDFFGARHGAYSGFSEIDTLWPKPVFQNLSAAPNWWAMSWGEYAGSLLLHFWVYLLITGIGAYVVSYYFSSHTIIYLLLRRSVDGQNLREVFLDEKKKPV